MRVSPVRGLLVVDKPAGMTSRDVVNRALAWFPRGTRLGHTGTLDPLATGVLVLCAGVATRLAEYVQRLDKVYRVGLRLGARSTTDDVEGIVETGAVLKPPDGPTLERAVQEFIGRIEQVPPAFSAAKISGRRAYQLARRGQAVALSSRQIEVYDLAVLGYRYPRLELEARCGKGTYIRALARDLGERLGCGALVETLRRTRVGPFTPVDAVPLGSEPDAARARLLPVSAAVSQLPHITVNASAVRQLRQGQAVSLGDGFDPDSRRPGLSRFDRAAAVAEAGNPAVATMEAAVFDATGELVAVAFVDRAAALLRPVKVIHLDSGEPGT